MVDPELKAFISAQLAAGQKVEDVRGVLAAKGWPKNQLDEAIPLPTPAEDSSTETTESKSFLTVKRAIILIIVLIVLCAAVVAAVWAEFNGNKKKEMIEKVDKKGSPQEVTSVVPATTSASIVYVSPEQGYGFTYPGTWELKKQGTLSSIASPDWQKGELYRQYGFGEVLVSSVPYTGTNSGQVASGVTVKTSPNTVQKSPTDQVKDLALQLASNKKVTGVKLDKLAGVQAVTVVAASEASVGASLRERSTLNMVFEGTKNIILIQFPVVSAQTELNEGQLMILKSLEEK